MKKSGNFLKNKAYDHRKLAIGSVQFGLDYGISNDSGKTTLSEVRKILTVARDFDITTIDTAYAYGSSEEVLGDAGIKGHQIISKFPAQETDMSFLDYLNSSLQRLKIESIYGYLAHNAQILFDNPEIWEELLKVKERGIVKKIGYSLYTPQELDFLLEKNFFPDLIQVPFNILDQRFEEKLIRLKESNVEIHTRSAFLQGLFFFNPDKLDPFFNEIKPFLISLNNLFPNNYKKAGYLLSYCLSKPYIDRVVIGVNNSDQLLENINGIEEYLITDHLEIPQISEKILMPNLWAINAK